MDIYYKSFVYLVDISKFVITFLIKVYNIKKSNQRDE